MDNTPNLALPLLAHKQALQTTFHDEAIKTLDALVMLSVIDRDLSSPPPSPNEGDRYIVKAPGSGDPAWLDDHVVVYLDGHWLAHAPRAGWTCYVQDEGALIAWDGTAWQPALDVLGGSAAQNLALLGVGTEADATNPVSFKVNNVLCTARAAAEGGDGDLRYKMSKEGAANTLSLLLQDNFSGRAEIGLTGDDDFHFKVSADGETWRDGIVIDKDTGAVVFPNTPGLGAAEIARRDNVLTPHEGLIVKYVTAATVDIDADAVVLFDGSGVSRRFPSVDLTANIATSGANGLDAGVEASNTWYHIWVIAKADGTVAGLLSTSSTAPTMPADYSYKGYVGAVRNDGSLNLVPIIQRGNYVKSDVLSVLDAGTALTYTTIDLSAGVPPTATAAVIMAATRSTSGSRGTFARFAPAGTSTTATYGYVGLGGYHVAGETANRLGDQRIPLSTPQQIVYYLDGASQSVDVNVTGWAF